MSEKDLGIMAAESISAQDAFGQMRRKAMAGIAGTLHISGENDLQTIPRAAWDLANQAGKPVVIVVRPLSQQ